MLGLGETREELLDVLADLLEVGCDLLTLGQYLRPSPEHPPVVRYVPPGGIRRTRPPRRRWASRTSPAGRSYGPATTPARWRKPDIMQDATRGRVLDRDGVVNEERHYLFDPELVVLTPGIAGAIRAARRGYVGRWSSPINWRGPRLLHAGRRRRGT